MAGQEDGSFQVVHVHTGQVLAHASNAWECVDYLVEYAKAVDQELASHRQAQDPLVQVLTDWRTDFLSGNDCASPQELAKEIREDLLS